MKLLFSLIAGFQLLNSQIQEIPKSQENKINKTPERKKIEYSISKKYGLDTLKNINFEVLPEDTQLGFSAIYSPWSDSLKLNYYGIKLGCERKNLNLDSVLSRIMKHELTHYRVDKMQEKLGLKSEVENRYSRLINEIYLGMLKVNEEERQDIPKAIFQTFMNMRCEQLTNITLDRMINEGISMYYDNPNANSFLMNWFKSIEDIKTYEDYEMFIYDGGLKLMRPIISAYGEKGIEYVLKNMPKYNDFSDLEAYQKKILKELGEQK